MDLGLEGKIAMITGGSQPLGESQGIPFLWSLQTGRWHLGDLIELLHYHIGGQRNGFAYAVQQPFRPLAKGSVDDRRTRPRNPPEHQLG